MRLPGGWWENGRRFRDFSFRAVNGSLELALAETGGTAGSWPASVTQVLTLALDRLGERRPLPETVSSLCVADRQFLLRRLQIHLGENEQWHHAACSECKEIFDIHLNLADLPVREAGEGFPFAWVTLENRKLRFRLPTGADQEAIADLENDDEAQRVLLRRCWAPEADGENQADWDRVEDAGSSTWEQIELALEEVSPSVITELTTTCPHCRETNRVELDPTAVLRQGSDPLLREVHQLAYHYHWSETEILELQRPRRQRYLQLIDQARGLFR